MARVPTSAPETSSNLCITEGVMPEVSEKEFAIAKDIVFINNHAVAISISPDILNKPWREQDTFVMNRHIVALKSNASNNVAK